MDREEKRFLKAAIRVQQSKNYGFSINGSTIQTCSNINLCSGNPETVKSESIELSFLSLEFLKDNQLIASQGVFAPLYYVTDKGWNYFRNRNKAFFQEILRSVLTPVVVSVITTLVTLWIQSHLL